MMKSIAKSIVLLGDVTQTLSIAYPFLDGGGAITMPSREGAERQTAFPVDRRDVAGLATTALSQKSSLGTRDDGKPCRHRRCATNGCFPTPSGLSVYLCPFYVTPPCKWRSRTAPASRSRPPGTPASYGARLQEAAHAFMGDSSELHKRCAHSYRAFLYRQARM